MIGTTISHYRILEKLGEGGMGVVYKAQDTNLDRFVALKFLSSSLSSSRENKARFLQEAKATAALTHPNILSVYEIGESDDSMFLAMEFLEGTTLKIHVAELKTGSGVPIHQALEWTENIALGLKAAHEKNIVHRDIKSENIMITRNGQLKIMDFGLAKLKNHSTLTKAGTSLGTLAYMSPEQAQGQTADARSDLWSLGIIFFELLTADLPFKSEHEAGLLYLIVNQDPPSPSELDRRIPHAVDGLARKLLAKDRNQRYQTADEVFEALRRIRQEMSAAATSEKQKAIAVLPFTNIGADKENEYFGDGLTEELIVHLSQLKNIDVVSKTSTMQFKGTNKDIKTIGRELGSRYILEGSVRKFQDNLRIAVQLIDVESGRQLWAESYKGTLADVFDIQEQVAKQIVDALMIKLTPTEKTVLSKRTTVNAEAFDCNLRARDFLSRRTRTSVNMAVQFFQKAIQLDPRYASAYAGLGESYGILYRDFDRKEAWLDRALDVSLKAIMYDASLSEAYASLALAYLGKSSLDEALEASQKAIILDPKNFNAYWILSRIYHTTDRDKEAADALEKAIALNPEFLQAYDDLVMYLERLGNKQKYDEVLHNVLQVYPGYLERYPDDAYRRMAFAVHLVYENRSAEARREGEKALETSSSDPIMMYYGACLYARLRENHRAVDLLRSAVENGYENFEWIKRDPDFENIRSEPGYIELLKGR
ncbi:MAG: protein kinase [Ignavibacteriales bacterium]|nr:protein kinase [Ignavibacteriales bacterium]